MGNSMRKSPEPFDFDSCLALFSCDLDASSCQECLFDDDRRFDCPSCSAFMTCDACRGRDICTMSPYFFGDEESNHG